MSWEFLNIYINNAQNRQELMKARLNAAIQGQKELTVLIGIKAQEDAKKAASAAAINARLVLEAEQKNAAADLEFERPQAMAQAIAFEGSSKEYFSLAPIFENSTAPQAKTFRLKLRMDVNRKIGQLTDSASQIKSIANDLVQLYFQSRSNSKEAAAYFLILLSTKILVIMHFANRYKPSF